MSQPDFRNLKLKYMRLFSTEDGIEVLRDLEDQAFFNDTTFQGDVNRLLINEGARLLLLRIRDLALSPMPPEEEAKDN